MTLHWLPLIAASAAALLAACAEPSGPSGSELEPFGGGLLLSVFESHGSRPAYMASWWPDEWTDEPGDPRVVLSLRVHPDSEISACGRELRTRFTVEEGEIAASVEGVETFPAVCGLSGPLHASTFLPSEEGEYTLDVRLLQHAYRYRLRVTAATLELEPVSPRFPAGAIVRTPVVPEFLTFLRYPPRSFALYCFDDRAGACADLAHEMRLRLDLEPFTFPERGRVPYVEIEADATSLARYFQYPSEPFPRGPLCALLVEHGLRVSGVTSWRGDHFNQNQCGSPE